MITITLPDGSIKQFDQPPTGMDVALDISQGLARNCVAMMVDDQLLDLNLPIEKDATVNL